VPTTPPMRNHFAQEPGTAVILSGQTWTEDSRSSKSRKFRLSEMDPELRARLPQPCAVPPFDEKARGTPNDWNEVVRSVFWGKHAQKLFPPVENAKVDVNKVMEFFEMRRDQNGNCISELISKPELVDGWFRCAWLGFDESAVPMTSPGKWNNGKSDWQIAWHGCKFEELYSIMCHGRLLASCNATLGCRFHPLAPGVCVHKHSTASKAEGYARWVPLCRDGTFWCAKVGAASGSGRPYSCEANGPVGAA